MRLQSDVFNATKDASVTEAPQPDPAGVTPEVKGQLATLPLPQLISGSCQRLLQNKQHNGPGLIMAPLPTSIPSSLTSFPANYRLTLTRDPL